MISSTLERRIEAMTDRIRRHRGRTALALAGGATIVLTFACEAPVPADPPASDGAVPGAEPETTVGGDRDAPAPPPSLGPDDIRSILQSSAPPVTSAPPGGFTPYEVAPELRNRAEVMSALQREYPPLLRDAGISGTVLLWLYIDETGFVENVVVNTTSGNPQLDDDALRVGQTFQFTPALDQGARTAVWIATPIRFEP